MSFPSGLILETQEISNLLNQTKPFINLRLSEVLHCACDKCNTFHFLKHSCVNACVYVCVQLNLNFLIVGKIHIFNCEHFQTLIKQCILSVL